MRSELKCLLLELLGAGFVAHLLMSSNLLGPRLNRLPQRLDYTLIPAPLGELHQL